MNRVFLIGNLTRDIELRSTGSGQQVGNMGIAVNEQFTRANGEKGEKVYFGDCVLWGKTAENGAKYLRKGSKVAVEGRLANDEWEDKEGKKQTRTRIQVDRLQFLDSKGDGSQGGKSKPAPAGGVPDPDIPFTFD